MKIQNVSYLLVSFLIIYIWITQRQFIFSVIGIHAREWISPAVALFILRQLVENKSYRTLISEVDWYILPMINADGYEYSHTVDRLWRKSRKITAKNSGR